MAMIKVFSVNGVKELGCFDTLDSVDYLPVEEDAAPEDLEAAED